MQQQFDAALKNHHCTRPGPALLILHTRRRISQQPNDDLPSNTVVFVAWARLSTLRPRSPSGRASGISVSTRTDAPEEFLRTACTLTINYVCDVTRVSEFSSCFSGCPRMLKRKMPWSAASRKLRRLIGPGAAIVFRGSGFYKTDYRSESYKRPRRPGQRSGGSTAPPSPRETRRPPRKASPPAARRMWSERFAVQLGKAWSLNPSTARRCRFAVSVVVWSYPGCCWTQELLRED